MGTTKNPAAIALPCGHSIPEAEILRLAGQIRAGRRQTHAPGPGRPRTAQRCPCGLMTTARAAQRRHQCSEEKR
jgi:hypothetical protein